MRDGATRDGAEHGQRIAIVAATELPADRRADDAAGSRDTSHTVGMYGLTDDLVPTLFARAIDRDVAHQRLDVDDAGGDDRRRIPVVAVAVRMTAAAAAMAAVGQGRRGAEKPQHRSSQKPVLANMAALLRLRSHLGDLGAQVRALGLNRT